MATGTEIREAVMAELERRAGDAGASLTPSTDLLDEGILDSLGLIDFVTWLEDTFSTAIDPMEIVIENFERPSAIVDFVESLL